MILAMTSLVAALEAEPNTDRVFQVLVRLLESSRLEPEQHDTIAKKRARVGTPHDQSAQQPWLRKDLLLQELQQARILFPSLSLDHPHDDSSASSSHNRDRNHAQEHATSLLARPVAMKLATQDKDAPVLLLEEDCNSSDAAASTSTTAPLVLLENVYKSFAVLVESRIRAYATLIARHHTKQQKHHPQNKGDMNERLDRLLRVAAAVYAERMETRFELNAHHADDAAAGMDLMEEEETDASVNSATQSTPLAMHVSFDLVMPRPGGEKQVVNISVEAPGDIQALPPTSESLGKKIEVIEVKLDTRKVLLGLMEQAAKVVTAVAEIASTDATVSRETHSSFPRSASFLAMPPPSPRKSSEQQGSDACSNSTSTTSLGKHNRSQYEQSAARRNLGLELLSRAAAVLPIVSPDVLSGQFRQGTDGIPTFRLEVAAMSLATKAASTTNATASSSVGSTALPDDAYDDEEDDVSSFSVDQCADIVDNILGDVDDSIFHLDASPKPTKKARTSIL